MPLDDHTEEQHESYGLAGFNRVTGDPGALFGSSIKHGHFMRLRIKRGAKVRGLHHDWYRGREDIVELDLSYTQFAELVSTMNVGDGVPCTLRHVNGEQMAEPPTADERTLFNEEFKEDMRRVLADADALAQRAEDLLKLKTLRKSDLSELVTVLSRLRQDLSSNMPFVQKSFNEANEKTVAQAKGEVEAFVAHKIHGLGIEALNRQIEAGSVVQLVDGPKALLPDESQK